MTDIVLKNVHAADPLTGLDEVCDIAVKDGIIERIGDCTGVAASRTIDCLSESVSGGLYAVPGLFDMHVHFRDPGFTYKEDIISGGMAAKAGGFTGALMMPNTKPVCDTPETVRYALEKGKKTGINVYTSCCITKGMKSGELCDFDELKKAGAIAVTDDGRPVENAELMRRALELTNENGLIALSHCEDLNIINGGIMNKGKVSQALGVRGMDRASEDYITAREIALAASCGARVHICHVSTKGSVNIIRAAKRDGVKVTCETAPHYFTYTDEKLYSRDARYRMSPPLRTEEDRKAIEDALLDGTIDCIITDHAPHSAEEKADFEKAPNGVVGLETSLAATLTKLYHSGRCDISHIVRLMSVNPRRILGLPPVKIEEGAVCDLCIFDPDREWTVVPEKLHSRSKNTVFFGETFRGRAAYTICGGKIVYELKDFDL